MSQKKAKNSDRSVGRTSCEHCGKTVFVPLTWDELEDLVGALDEVGESLMIGLAKIAAATNRGDHTRMSGGAKMIVGCGEDLRLINESLRFVIRVKAMRSKVGGATEKDKDILSDEARRTAAVRN